MNKSIISFSHILLFLIIVIFFFSESCTPPRAVFNSGKVTAHKNIVVGGDFSANISTHFAKELYNNIEGIVTPILNEDSIILDDQVLQLNKSAMAYALDPFGSGYGFYLRYGILPNTDIGYRYTSGTHVFDGRYQFLGTSKNENENNNIHGSIGFQYSSKSYNLPSWSGLDKVQSLLDFEFNRKDMLFPLIFSLPFGSDEKYGSFGWGLVYSHSFIKYGINNENIYDTLNSVSPELIDFINQNQNFSSVGGFINLKLGYKFIYLVPSFAIYYQNYGNYMLLDGSQTKFKGFSFIPYIGIQVNPTFFKKNKNQHPSVNRNL
ncbi:MAG: hypothetical protein PHT69_06490 [Bacteroidales bacterium]|nr:hypothetical protein [Bacteroidales bacterium]